MRKTIAVMLVAVTMALLSACSAYTQLALEEEQKNGAHSLTCGRPSDYK